MCTKGLPPFPLQGQGVNILGFVGPLNPASYCYHPFPVSAPKQCQTRVSQPQEDRSWLCILRRNWQNKPLILSSRLCESLCGEDKGRGTGSSRHMCEHLQPPPQLHPPHWISVGCSENAGTLWVSGVGMAWTRPPMEPSVPWFLSVRDCSITCLVSCQASG